MVSIEYFCHTNAACHTFSPTTHVAVFNGGVDKLEESRIEVSHQSMTRDNHKLARMKDED